MTDIDTLNRTFCLEPSWLIPLDSNLKTPKQKVLQDTAIIVENQLIKDILPIPAAQQKYPKLPRKVLKNQVVLPGFINAHSHTPMNLLKGYADDLPLMTWLNDYIWPIENKYFSDQFAYDGAVLAIAEMLKSGITCFNDMYFYSNSIAKAADKLGIRANIGTHVFDPPSPWAKNIDEYIQHCLNVNEQYKDHKLINAVMCPHAPYTVSDDSFKKIIKTSSANSIPIGCHIHETEDEIQQSLNEYGMRPLARLEKLGLLEQNLYAIHMVQLTAEEIELTAKNNIPIAHCPESNLKLASGFCPIKELQERDIVIALGTDGAASNNDLDMLGEMRTASLVAKASAKDPTVLNDYDTLKAATFNGAQLMGLENTTGSLTIGKEADIISIDLDDIGSKPVYDPISSIVYTATRQQVTNVWVNGIQKVADKQLTVMSQEAICDIVTSWHDKIAAMK